VCGPCLSPSLRPNIKRMQSRQPRGKRGQKRPREDERSERPADAYVCDAATGLRHVNPYVYEFRTSTKGRWQGRGIYEVCALCYQAAAMRWCHVACWAVASSTSPVRCL